MSNVMNQATKTKLLSLSSVHANYLDNVSRSLTCYADSYEGKSDKQKLAGLIAEAGWSPTETLGVTAMSEDEIAIATAQREATWAELREASAMAQSESDTIYKVKTTNAVILNDDSDENYITQVSAKMELEAFERLYVKSGKVIVPEFSLIWGFRRTGVLPLVNAVRRDQLQEEITKMSFVIMTFDSIDQRHMLCIQENTNKATGLKTLSAVDCLAAAKTLFNEGATQATLRKTFSHGTGQKLHAFLALNAQHLDLDLYNRCMLPAKDSDDVATPNYIKFSALNKEKLRTLGGIDKGKNQCEPATKEEVNEYMANPNDDKPEKVSTMSKGDIAIIAKQHPSKIVQMIAGAIGSNDKETIKSFNLHADRLNELAQEMGLFD